MPARFTGMKRLCVLLLLLAGCSQSSQPVAHMSATPSPSTAAASPPAVASPSTPPAQLPFDLPLSPPAFSCRLPIFTADFKDAFISFPSGAVSIDPQVPPIQSYGGRYYDRAYSRWLPVAREAVSPDGRRYAYTQPAPDQTKMPTIHVVDLATGVDRGFTTPSQQYFISFGVLDYTSQGIYLYQAYESPRFGLWLLNPSNGAMSKVADLNYILSSAGNKIFWLGGIDPNDAHNIGTLFSVADELRRYNLADGSAVTWLYRPGKGLQVDGIDPAGHPIVDVISSYTASGLSDDLVLVLSPGSSRTILTAPSVFVESLGASITDSHGVWFGSQQGIYLYSSSGGLQKVSNQPGYPANGCL